MVHGTAAWKGTWWSPGGDFHDYVKEELRSDMYSGGKSFSWTGKYNEEHRSIAAERLARWAEGEPLNTVFAHSYGGMIALEATSHGLVINELVLLSTPREKNVPIEWDNIGRAVSLRIHLDLVLLAARRRQSFDLPVAEHFLPQRFRKHSDSHNPEVWRKSVTPGVLV